MKSNIEHAAKGFKEGILTISIWIGAQDIPDYLPHIKLGLEVLFGAYFIVNFTIFITSFIGMYKEKYCNGKID